MDAIAVTTFLTAALVVISYVITKYYLHIDGCNKYMVMFLIFAFLHELLLGIAYVILGGSEGPIACLAQFWKDYALADERYAGTDGNMFTRALLGLFIIAPLCLKLVSLLRCNCNTAIVWLAVLGTIFLMCEVIQFLPELLNGMPNLKADFLIWPQLFLYHLIFVIFAIKMIKKAHCMALAIQPAAPSRSVSRSRSAHGKEKKVK